MTERWYLWLHSLRFFTSLLLKWILCLCSLRCFTTLLFKWNFWLCSLPCFTSVLLKWNLRLPSLRCFSYYYEIEISHYAYNATLIQVTKITSMIQVTEKLYLWIYSLRHYAVLLQYYWPQRSNYCHYVGLIHQVFLFPGISLFP